MEEDKPNAFQEVLLEAQMKAIAATVRAGGRTGILVGLLIKYSLVYEPPPTSSNEYICEMQGECRLHRYIQQANVFSTVQNDGNAI